MKELQDHERELDEKDLASMAPEDGQFC